MNSYKKNVIYICFCLFVIYAGAVRPVLNHRSHMTNQPLTTNPGKRQPAKKRPVDATEQFMRTPIDWRKSSETKPYPDLAKVKDLNVLVSIRKNRTYLRDGQHVIYTMYSSAGQYHRQGKRGKNVSYTPVGTFYIQQARGMNFFNQRLNEGANYYVSWLNNGEYLFHSVPTKADGSYDRQEARKLGKSTGSHGCVRLSVSDARWMMEHLPVGTKVTIEN
ncbi:L,D-transpeptidase [uncultured Limosilactobacillus sp.]|uniref:L,D-transpeptidase n=1 Tax=uncultured Limosilactobacillus sp. TaxID=2837629 RepID=UPI0025D43DA4|nr:L,D-transpeptidase [uncultured Limosilactobacillus sp.]